MGKHRNHRYEQLANSHLWSPPALKSITAAHVYISAAKRLPSFGNLARVQNCERTAHFVLRPYSAASVQEEGQACLPPSSACVKCWWQLKKKKVRLYLFFHQIVNISLWNKILSEKIFKICSCVLSIQPLSVYDYTLIHNTFL